MSGNKGIILQPRDLLLLREASAMRILDREQAMLVAGFGSITRTNTRLLALVREGLLRRFFLGSGGGRKAVYAISPKGAQTADVPCRGPRRPQGALLVVDNFVQHQLAVNDLHCTFKYRAIPFPQVAFHRWLYFYVPLSPDLGLIPDGYVEFLVDSRIVPCFIELDLGHESLSIWKEKADHYVELSDSEDFAMQFGQEVFGVLVIANTERRMHSIRKAVATVTESIFRFATLEAVRDGFFDPVWCQPADATNKSLFEIPQ